jgi:hypothetical protein
LVEELRTHPGETVTVLWCTAQQYSDVTAAPTPGVRGHPDHNRSEEPIFGKDIRCG